MLGVNLFIRRSYSKVGFIGLGQMGNPMAKNLLSKGERLVVYDTSSSATARFSDVANSIKQLASSCSIIITMLPDGNSVSQAYNGKDGVFQNAKQGALLIDCSTIENTTAADLQKTARSFGLKMLDAPVSGGVPGAEAGTLSFMVGGDKHTYEHATSLLLKMGRNLIYCGNSGSGQIAKACNNMLLGISMAGLCEALVLGERLGLDPKVLSKVINSSSGRCWSSEIYNPVAGVCPNSPANRDYSGGFSVKLLNKDLGLALHSANTGKIDLPLAKATSTHFKQMGADAEYQSQDFSALYKRIRSQKQHND